MFRNLKRWLGLDPRSLKDRSIRQAKSHWDKQQKRREKEAKASRRALKIINKG